MQDACCFEQLQTRTRPESFLPDGSPALGLAPSEGKWARAAEI